MTNSQFTFIIEVSHKIFRLSNLSVSVAEYLASLFALESDFGNSSIAKDFHNYCGMKTPLVRLSSALNAGKVSSNDFWAKYENLDSCVFDFLLCLNYHRPCSDDLDSIPHIQRFLRWYCPEQNYHSKVMSVYDSYCKCLERLK